MVRLFRESVLMAVRKIALGTDAKVLLTTAAVDSYRAARAFKLFSKAGGSR